MMLYCYINYINYIILLIINQKLPYEFKYFQEQISCATASHYLSHLFYFIIFYYS